MMSQDRGSGQPPKDEQNGKAAPGSSGAARPSGLTAADALSGRRSQRSAEGKDAPSKKEESWIDIVKTLVYAVLIALFIRSFAIQPFNIPSGSMKSTLLVGDYLFVEKYAYGYSRYSFPWGLGPLGELWHGRIFASQPKRGDVVVFRLPSDPSIDYIKRVIGLPGDTVQMIHDRLYINNRIVPEKRVSDFVETIDGYQRRVPRYEEFLPGGKTHYILDSTPDGPYDNTKLFKVPPGHYFMMGDNRDNSDDSRADVGYVPAQNLVGKAELIFFSVNDKASWWQVWKWPWSIRWDRLFKVID